MKAKKLSIHAQNPQPRLIAQVIDIINAQGVIAYPTDSGYALGCLINSKKAFDTICHIRQFNKQHNFTLMLAHINDISDYAQMDNDVFRLLKKTLPGGYTYILPSAKLTPNRLVQAKRKTIGIRISAHAIVSEILKTLKQPLMSVSLTLNNKILYDANDVYENVAHQVNLVIDGGYCPPQPTTVVDLTIKPAQILRQGSGENYFLN